MLTNAACVLALSTSNRFLRTIERMRGFAANVEKMKASLEIRTLLINQLDRTSEQAVLLLGALRGAYVAAGSFTAATLTSIVGAAMTPHYPRLALWTAAVALAVGVLGAAALILACKRLVTVTRASIANMSAEAAYVRQHHQAFGPPP